MSTQNSCPKKSSSLLETISRLNVQQWTAIGAALLAGILVIAGIAWGLGETETHLFGSHDGQSDQLSRTIDDPITHARLILAGIDDYCYSETGELICEADELDTRSDGTPVPYFHRLLAVIWANYQLYEQTHDNNLLTDIHESLATAQQMVQTDVDDDISLSNRFNCLLMKDLSAATDLPTADRQAAHEICGTVSERFGTDTDDSQRSQLISETVRLLTTTDEPEAFLTPERQPNIASDLDDALELAAARQLHLAANQPELAAADEDNYLLVTHAIVEWLYLTRGPAINWHLDGETNCLLAQNLSYFIDNFGLELAGTKKSQTLAAIAGDEALSSSQPVCVLAGHQLNHQAVPDKFELITTPVAGSYLETLEINSWQAGLLVTE